MLSGRLALQHDKLKPHLLAAAFLVFLLLLSFGTHLVLQSKGLVSKSTGSGPNHSKQAVSQSNFQSPNPFQAKSRSSVWGFRRYRRFSFFASFKKIGGFREGLQVEMEEGLTGWEFGRILGRSPSDHCLEGCSEVSEGLGVSHLFWGELGLTGWEFGPWILNLSLSLSLSLDLSRSPAILGDGHRFNVQPHGG